MMPEQPFISIITPVYNGAAYLDDLIQSVLNQDFPEIEHIVIDDGSSDDGATPAVLAKYPHLLWWSRENKGQYATMNEGLQAAHGKFVCFICADDMMAPGAAGWTAEYLQTHPDFDGIYGPHIWVDQNKELYRSQRLIRRAPLKLYRYMPFIAHSSLYLNRERLLANSLLFDPRLRFLGDYDWIVRVISQGFRIGELDRALSYIRAHPGQTSRSYAAKDQERRMVLKRHHVNYRVFMGSKAVQYGLSAFLRAWRALKQSGPKGPLALLNDWYKRHYTKV